MSTAKEQVLKIIGQLPDDVSADDIFSEIQSKLQVDAGLKELDESKSNGKEKMIEHIKSKLNDNDKILPKLCSNEKKLLNIIFPQKLSIKINNNDYKIKKKKESDLDNNRLLYDLGNNRPLYCDRVLSSQNGSNDKIWIECKPTSHLLPINCGHTPEKITLGKDAVLLDIARLLSLVENKNDIRMIITSSQKKLLEYYGEKTCCGNNISYLLKCYMKNIHNKSKISQQYPFFFFLSDYKHLDILPTEKNRKKNVELYYNAKLSFYLLHPINSCIPIIIFIDGGKIRITVYRDIDNPKNEGNSISFNMGEAKNHANFIGDYFPAS
ncbi:MAG: hypothetical protein C4527_02895 [Candidatus Omnitrophota bacterium]|jgi:hypothetical protein|nr:MAG: hypothetical protein C4527_02895 [Candidatus Omnitrophota bacterium]